MSVWLIVAIVVVALIVIIGLAMLWRSRHRQKLSARASEIRAEAREHAAEVGETRRDARQAELEAEQARLEAERAARDAETKRQALMQEEATHEDRLREADRLDPNVDHEADDYQPSLRARSEGDAEEATAEAEDQNGEGHSVGGQHRL